MRAQNEGNLQREFKRCERKDSYLREFASDHAIALSRGRSNGSMCRTPFRSHSIHTYTYAQSLHIVGEASCVAGRQELGRMSTPRRGQVSKGSEKKIANGEAIKKRK